MKGRRRLKRLLAEAEAGLAAAERTIERLDAEAAEAAVERNRLEGELADAIDTIDRMGDVLLMHGRERKLKVKDAAIQVA